MVVHVDLRHSDRVTLQANHLDALKFWSKSCGALIALTPLTNPGQSPESLHELEPGFRFSDSITELVHQSVMPPADKNQIIELRFTPVRPVYDVVTVDIAALGTTRILAGPIAGS